jgi:hypothetical protein
VSLAGPEDVGGGAAQHMAGHNRGQAELLSPATQRSAVRNGRALPPQALLVQPPPQLPITSAGMHRGDNPAMSK